MSAPIDYKVRAAALRDGAAAIVSENDRMLWATKPGKHWAADLLIGMAETSDAVAEQGALPMPSGPEPRDVEEELTGANLSLWEEEQTTIRLRLALASAQRGRRDLRDRVAELEAERHSTNESLDDAAKALRADRDRIAELEALTPAAIQTCRVCGAGYSYGQSCGTCAFRSQMAAELQVRGLEGEHYPATHHSYTISHDLPESGGA